MLLQDPEAVKPFPVVPGAKKSISQFTLFLA